MNQTWIQVKMEEYVAGVEALSALELKEAELVAAKAANAVLRREIKGLREAGEAVDGLLEHLRDELNKHFDRRAVDYVWTEKQRIDRSLDDAVSAGCDRPGPEPGELAGARRVYGGDPSVPTGECDSDYPNAGP